MRVKLDSTGGGVGGVSRVYEGIYKHLPAYGVEFVKDNPDVYHAHIALYEDISPNLPLVVSSHGMLWEEHGWGRVGNKTNKMCIEAYRQADVVTTPSDFVAHALQRHMLLDPMVVRHGIDSDEWLPGENRGYVLWNKARIDPANDPSIVNKLAQKLSQIDFVSTFGVNDSNVKITGVISLDQMKKLVGSAAVYLDTAKESGGPCFGVLEAYSCGVPVLSWNDGGTPEAVIHKETGYLAEDFDDLVNGLIYCLQHRERLGRNAYDYVRQHYQWPMVVEGYYQAYQQAIHPYSTKVSVVVPCYNLGKFLPACVESVQSQSFSDWEMVIVNDASTDDSGEIAEKLAANDSRIKVIQHDTNQHVSASRNTGISLSGSKYVLPLDADDRLAPDALLNMVKVLDSDRTFSIVSGKLILFEETDLTKGRLGEWPNNPDYELQIQGYNRFPYSSLYRKKVWERVGGYRRRIRDGVEDADFWTRALSFGFRGLILDQPTLYYTLRSDGLGKKNTRGTDAWLPWFGWAGNEEIAPFVVGGPVVAYDKPVVSVIIPVGPNHTQYIQGCIDSLLAQTEPSWEAVVINDTGHPISLPGMPFVRLINLPSNQGVAAARNAGIKAAKADKIIFLDVDDVAQPRMVELLLKAHANAGGWIYADWVGNEAQDWNLQKFLVKMLAPITGLYEKKHLEEVGGFNETITGWEDYDLQLKLVSQGICGTRVAYPAIYYNMDAGFRREENFSRAEELVQYIQATYGDKKMACGKCGGKSTLNVKATTVPATDGQVLMSYVGPHSSTFTRRSPTVKGAFYRINNRRPFSVAKSDVPFFLRNPKDYRVAEKQPTALVADQTAVLTAPVIEQTIDDLPLDTNVRTILKRQFNSVSQLKLASDADLLSIKGVGERRVQEIRAALHG